MDMKSEIKSNFKKARKYENGMAQFRRWDHRELPISVTVSGFN